VTPFKPIEGCPICGEVKAEGHFTKGRSFCDECGTTQVCDLCGVTPLRSNQISLAGGGLCDECREIVAEREGWTDEI